MTNDPMESRVRDALSTVGLKFTEGDKNPARLDFLIEEHGIYIEAKQFHSDRIAEQMARAPNVIAVQGRDAVEWLSRLIETAGRNAHWPIRHTNQQPTSSSLAPTK